MRDRCITYGLKKLSIDLSEEVTARVMFFLLATPVLFFVGLGSVFLEQGKYKSSAST